MAIVRGLKKQACNQADQVDLVDLVSRSHLAGRISVGLMT